MHNRFSLDLLFVFDPPGPGVLGVFSFDLSSHSHHVQYDYVVGYAVWNLFVNFNREFFGGQRLFCFSEDGHDERWSNFLWFTHLTHLWIDCQ